MKSLFLIVESWTTRLAMVIACLMMAIAASLAVFQIFTRFVLEQPAEWSEVLIRFSLIWMVFLGIPMAFRQGAMISVDALYRAAPTHLKRVLDLIVALAALVLMVIILWWGYDYAVRGSVQSMAGLETLSMFWAYIALPVGAVFSIIAIVANYLDPRRMELETAQ
ncbi:MAG: TRAP transporter small permease [Burkholderiales bacterium]|nr:TRAP transporter small permease [Burkholderiales bacterium]MBK8664729.1 TRAP transporter small permease [Burkholderiales bacterium]